MNTLHKIILTILLIIIGFLYLNNKKEISDKENTIQQLENSLSKKIDTFLLIKDTTIKAYITSKKYIVKYDTLYSPGKDSICDSLVIALKNSLNKCDTLVNISDTIIKTMLVRDTVRKEHIKYLKNKDIFSTVIGVGGGITPQGIQPHLGITFGLKIK